ncbi:MAG: GTPase HflX [Planctomycetota bacterium]
METGQREKLAVASERAVLVACLLPDSQVNPHDPLDELRSLAATAGAVVVDEMLQKRQKPSAKTFLGKGKVAELAERVKLHNAQVVILENDLSPSQLGNIEKVCEVKIIDRSELILDIFAARARTHEARLQVELAQLEYTYPRLRSMWTHLERIAGGAPAGIGTRGPGEQQLEIDRRIVQRKKSVLKKEIQSLQSRKTREVESRNTDHFTVGLVGYTNAGKSTLFNTATDGEAYAADQLFATLSTRTREWKLGNGDQVMLSDTVGFVRDLPHHLVASFKATLEEAVHSDLLLVVLDVADPHCRRQLDTVDKVLDDIGATQQPRLLVLNKIDKVDHNVDLLLLQKEYPDAIPLSAATGRHVDQLVEAVRDHLHGGTVTLTLNLAQADGKALTFLENRSTVLEREYEGIRVFMTVKIGLRQLDQLQAMGTSAILPDEYVESAGTPGSSWGR